MKDMIQEIQAGRRHSWIFWKIPEAYDKREELKAMEITARALIMYAERHAEKLEELALTERDPTRKRNWKAWQPVCRRVPAQAPRTMHEALAVLLVCSPGSDYGTESLGFL